MQWPNPHYIVIVVVLISCTDIVPKQACYRTGSAVSNRTDSSPVGSTQAHKCLLGWITAGRCLGLYSVLCNTVSCPQTIILIYYIAWLSFYRPFTWHLCNWAPSLFEGLWGCEDPTCLEMTTAGVVYISSHFPTAACTVMCLNNRNIIEFNYDWYKSCQPTSK